MLCPLPVIKLQEYVAARAPGDTVVILCSDPGVVNDIPAWCRIYGHRVLDIAHEGQDIRITIELGES